MAGISISAIVGDNGVIVKAQKAKEENSRAEIKEELEMRILDVQIEKAQDGQKLTNNDISNAISDLNGIEIDASGSKIEGEYKEYGFEIDEEGHVVVGEKLIGGKPEGYAQIITMGEGLSEVRIQVNAEVRGSEIVSIEAIDSAKVKLETDVNNAEKIFVVNENGIYGFKISSKNGRSCKVYCTVSNAMNIRDDLLNAVASINKTTKEKVRIIGKDASGKVDSVEYTLDVIYHDGDLNLDGKQETDILSGTTYQFGNIDCVGSQNADASAMVVLKVNGNLTISSGITVTSIASDSGYGGPKGMMIYCTGTLTNNGTISMTARGAKAPGENVYLFKNTIDETFEYVPKSRRKWWGFCCIEWRNRNWEEWK